MAQSRSSSVPLINIDNNHDHSSQRLPRSSFSLSSIQPLFNHSNSSMSYIWQNTKKTTISDSDNDNSSSDDNTDTNITHRQSSPDILSSNTLDLSSDILYEDIWIDSPTSHEYLHSLETWLYRYLTWLERVEQCRQLEIAYSKSILSLYDQSLHILNEPFHTSKEVNRLHWSTLPTEERESWDNEHVRNILRTRIKDQRKVDVL
ncbi:hypothetical protein BDB01DRAFT_60210 [Pilobolus umbonatus]|nr:hypothetical protein BDB01DRAFT_60210 [Pilobolus umbonatus]